MTAMLLAAMFLSGSLNCAGMVNAAAPNADTQIVMGDVNGDGKVDVADITAIVKIIMENGGGTVHNYTWYLGETEQESFTTADFNMTGTKPTVLNIGPSSGDKATVWIYPQSWGKPTKILDPNGNDMTNAFIYGDDWMTIPNGYYGGWTQLTLNTTWRVTWPETYYWYIGQTNPADMSSIDPIVSDTSSPGWRLIGTNVPDYSSTNMLWNGDTNNIVFANRDYYYVAVPKQTIQLYNVLNGSVMDSYTTTTTIINGITYYVYRCNTKARAFGYNIY